jgi:hypothetical protein
MKISKEQLKQIIKEELSQAIKEGDLEEGFLDKLLGRSKSSKEFVTPEEIRDLITKAINSLGDLVRVASQQDNTKLADEAARIKRDVMSLSSLEVPRGTGEMPNPQDFSGDAKRPRATDPGGRMARQRTLGESE